MLAAFALAALAGCGPEKTAEAPSDRPSAPAGGASATAPASGETGAATVATGAPQGSVKVGDRAVCAVCAVRDGTTEPEEVKATLDYKGKTYAFCNLDEKAEFISNPSKYAGGKP
jgi:YHS domain-containing protein